MISHHQNISLFTDEIVFTTTSITFASIFLWPWLKVKVIRLRRIYLAPVFIYLLHNKFDGHCLRSFWDNRTFSIVITNTRLTLNEGQGQIFLYVKHTHDLGVHHAKFDDLSDSFWDIAVPGRTDRQTHRNGAPFFPPPC